jgi:enolase
MSVASIVARQLLDCKARPLVEVEITTDTSHVGRGASSQNRGHTLALATAQCYFRGAVWSAVLAGLARVVLVSGETR